MKHTVIIRWSEEDGCFLMFLPEFRDTVMQPVTHGDNYEDALKNALEVLELLEETSVGKEAAFIPRSQVQQGNAVTEVR